MQRFLRGFPFIITIGIFSLSLASCAGRRSRPCGEGGQPAREVPWKGDKQCEQIKDPQGKWVNEGIYREFYPGGERALQGEYKNGQKSGTWTEWDESGKKISEHYFVEGVEVPNRTSVNADDKRR